MPLPRAGSFGFNTKKSAEETRPAPSAFRGARARSTMRVVARVAGSTAKNIVPRDLLVGRPRGRSAFPPGGRARPDRDPDNARPRRSRPRREQPGRRKRPEDQSLHGASGYRRARSRPVVRFCVAHVRLTASSAIRSARRRAVTAALVLVTALASFESTVVSTADADDHRGPRRPPAATRWVFSIYLLTSTVAMPIYGRLADIHGRRRLMLVAIARFPDRRDRPARFARSMPQLIAARAIQGLGAAGSIPDRADGLGRPLLARGARAHPGPLLRRLWGFAALVGPLARRVSHGALRLEIHLLDQHPAGRRSRFFLVATRMIESRAPLPDPAGRRRRATLAVGVTLCSSPCCTRRPARPRSLAASRWRLLSRRPPSARGLRAAPDAGARIRSCPRSSSGAGRRRLPISPASCSERRSTAWTRSCRSSCRAPAAEPPAPREPSSRRSSSSGRLCGRRGGELDPAARVPQDGCAWAPCSSSSGLARPRGAAPSRNAAVPWISRGLRARGRRTRAVLDVPGARDPARRAGAPARRRDEPRPLLPHRRRIDRRRRARRRSRRGRPLPRLGSGWRRKPLARARTIRPRQTVPRSPSRLPSARSSGQLRLRASCSASPSSNPLRRLAPETTASPQKSESGELHAEG